MMASTLFPESKRSKSGEHPAVQAMRDKLESIVEHTVPSLDELDRKLTDYINEKKSTPPPPPPEEEK